MADVDVPVIGNTDKRYVYAGGALVVGIAGYAYLQHRRSAAAAAAPVADPATGSNTGSDAYVNPAPVAFQPSPGGAVPGPAANDQDWTNRCLSDLENDGYDPKFIIDTLGKYLAAQGLTTDEAKLVRDAWAHEGKPPQHLTLGIVMLGSGGGSPGGGNTPPPVWHPIVLPTEGVTRGRVIGPQPPRTMQPL